MKHAAPLRTLQICDIVGSCFIGAIWSKTTNHWHVSVGDVHVLDSVSLTRLRWEWVHDPHKQRYLCPRCVFLYLTGCKSRFKCSVLLLTKWERCRSILSFLSVFSLLHWFFGGGKGSEFVITKGPYINYRWLFFFNQNFDRQNYRWKKRGGPGGRKNRGRNKIQQQEGILSLTSA